MFVLKRGLRLMGLSGEFYDEEDFGPLRRNPRMYKTRKGAERKATQVRAKVLELDARGIIIPEVCVFSPNSEDPKECNQCVECRKLEEKNDAK